MEAYAIDDDKAGCVILVEKAWQTVWGDPPGSRMHDTMRELGKVPPAVKFYGSYEDCKTLADCYGGKPYDTGRWNNSQGTWLWERRFEHAFALAKRILPLLESHGGYFQLKKAKWIREEFNL